MPEFIDLGVSDDAVEVIEAKAGNGHKKHFPCLYITSKEPIDLGDSGTAEIRYKLVEKAERERDGKEEHRYEIEVHGIQPMEMDDEDEPKKGLTQNFGEALDKAEASRNKSDY